MNEDENTGTPSENPNGEQEAPEQEESEQGSEGEKNLDDIDDPEELRRIAREKSAIASRLAKKAERKEEKPGHLDPSQFVTKAEQAKKNEQKAIKLATEAQEGDSEELSELKEEIDANWDAIKRFYRNVSGKDDPQDIYEDILDAHAAWKRRGPAPKGDGGKQATADLSASRGGKGTSPKNPQPARKRILSKESKPSEWYG